MSRKYSIAGTTMLAVLLLIIAMAVYPGGERDNAHSVGFDWTKNYISNLFPAKAINGASNTSRPFAIAGMFFISLSFGIFFYNFSKKINSKHARLVIRYGGIAAALFEFFAVTPYHDLMLTIADVFLLLSVFYITVFLFKARLVLLGLLCCLFLACMYTLTYIYFSGSLWNILPVIQKVQIVLGIIWMLSLEYFTRNVEKIPA
ncbi:hypothetical protein [Taibaiella soli]|uniref:DUF998 domain-containing protein n=1 Tax=Taibaiella soli TaxID=1649169 RepID=A0A2W2BG64_9BACT|nr:hypothetical protein [Taibaiella soli]PZF72466.1 hypothetical protein DN068_14055 [Taibaiella soli]